MPNYYTHYWSLTENMQLEGEPLDHTPGKLFSKSGITVGDFVYIVAVHQGRLYLIGRIQDLLAKRSREDIGCSRFVACQRAHNCKARYNNASEVRQKSSVEYYEKFEI